MNRKNRRMIVPPKDTDANPEERVLTITEMGAQGDGIALLADRTIFVPYTLASEQVKARFHSPDRAMPTEILQPSPERVFAPCRYFGECGGCDFQHWRQDAYLQWKQASLNHLFLRHGLSLSDAKVLPILALPVSSRRRATFAIRREGKDLIAGFRRARSHAIVDLQECHVALPALNHAFHSIRPFFHALLPREKEIACLVTLADNGIDLFVTADWDLNETHRAALVKIPKPENLRRITWQRGSNAPELLFLAGAPSIRLDGEEIELPPGAFLQPSREGEKWLQEATLTALAKSKKIADLYSGIGTFALPLARKAKVHAVEKMASAMEALEKAARKSLLHGRLTTEKRDLDRSPLSLEELQHFDAVILDPPRAGAMAQIEWLARSDIKNIVLISCAPDSFARDAALLQKGGYRLLRLQVLDQFSYSRHSEIFAHFRHR